MILFNFFMTGRSASNLTLDSIDDFSRYSDDAGRESDERVAGMSLIYFLLFAELISSSSGNLRVAFRIFSSTSRFQTMNLAIVNHVS